MPKNEFDPEDPMELVGVSLLTDEDTLAPMAECFIEEFLRMGHSQEQIAGMFQNPFYAGPALVTRAKGMAFVKQLIADTFSKWGRTTPGVVRGSPACVAEANHLLAREGTTSARRRPDPARRRTEGLPGSGDLAVSPAARDAWSETRAQQERAVVGPLPSAGASPTSPREGTRPTTVLEN